MLLLVPGCSWYRLNHLLDLFVSKHLQCVNEFLSWLSWLLYWREGLLSPQVYVVKTTGNKTGPKDHCSPEGRAFRAFGANAMYIWVFRMIHCLSHNKWNRNENRTMWLLFACFKSFVLLVALLNKPVVYLCCTWSNCGSKMCYNVNDALWKLVISPSNSMPYAKRKHHATQKPTHLPIPVISRSSTFSFAMLTCSVQISSDVCWWTAMFVEASVMGLDTFFRCLFPSTTCLKHKFEQQPEEL